MSLDPYGHQHPRDKQFCVLIKIARNDQLCFVKAYGFGMV